MLFGSSDSLLFDHLCFSMLFTSGSDELASPTCELRCKHVGHLCSCASTQTVAPTLGLGSDPFATLFYRFVFRLGVEFVCNMGGFGLPFQ